MKNFLKKSAVLIGLTIVLSINFSFLTFAQKAELGGVQAQPDAPTTTTPAKTTPSPLTIDQYLPSMTYKSSSSTNKDNVVDKNVLNKTNIGAVANLPNADWNTTLVYVIKVMLNITAGMTLLALTVGGAMMVLAGGEGSLLENGKKIVINTSIGLIIIAVAYALVLGVAEMQFFSNTTPSSTTTTKK